MLELYGYPIAPENGSSKAHIIFSIFDNSFSGDAGCNRIMGTYRLGNDNQIILSSAATTMMMCIDMETESKFLQVGETVDSYLIQGDNLTLNSKGQIPFAKFGVVYFTMPYPDR
jgi:heat shock protein HslJ